MMHHFSCSLLLCALTVMVVEVSPEGSIARVRSRIEAQAKARGHLVLAAIYRHAVPQRREKGRDTRRAFAVILMLAVDATREGRGLGSAAVEWLKWKSAAEDIPTLVVISSSSSGAATFWQKPRLGFMKMSPDPKVTAS